MGELRFDVEPAHAASTKRVTLSLSFDVEGRCGGALADVVAVNDEAEARRGRQLRRGDVVAVGGESVRVA